MEVDPTTVLQADRDRIAVLQADSDKDPSTVLQADLQADSDRDPSVVLQADRDPEMMDQDVVQHDIDKWVEFCDELKAYLQHGIVTMKTSRNIRKVAENFILAKDGNIYRKKTAKDGSSTLQVLVIRNYEDRLRIVKDIHLNTGDETRHHRRDKMLELVGQQYYWKGQRRDICECIASCEVCSVGLGSFRFSKPPGQARDVRSPAKLQKLSLSPLTVSSPIATAGHLQPTTKAPILFIQGVQASGPGSEESPYAVAISKVDTESRGSTQVVGLYPSVSQSPSLSSARDTLVAQATYTTAGFDLSTLNPITTSSGTSIMEVLHSSAHELPQIFTTINVPSTESVDVSRMDEGNNSLAPPAALSDSISALQSTSTVQLVDPPTTSSAGALSNATIHFQTCPSSIARPESVSMYQRLFKLPSQPNESLSSPVVEAMHVAMKESVDPIQLAQASETHLRQILSLTTSFSVLVAPNRAAAYLLALAASMVRVDPLSVNPHASRPSPLAVIHDTYCQGSLPSVCACSSLLGAINWNLGTFTAPMDDNLLSTAITSNRVAAVFYQPYCYLEGSQSIPLNVINSICRAQERLSIILDADGLAVGTTSLAKVVAAVKEWFVKGADFILLPKTEKIRGPPETCLLVGRSSLLKEVDLALLQPQICLPLTCTAYDLVGTVIAYQTLVLR